MRRRAVVFGAGGFIGGHLVKQLKKEGYYVRGVDIKHPEFEHDRVADEFILADLRYEDNVAANVHDMDEVYQLAADMGGAGYIFTGEHDADVMHNSGIINMHTASSCVKFIKHGKMPKVFYSSSACMYPEHNQLDPDNPQCEESSAYPANPDSEYGWEKLFSERLYLSFNRNYKLPVRIGRFHNIYGPCGTYKGGREKAPAAICRKVIEAKDNTNIEIWGDGKQTRSFLYINDCISAIRMLMRSNFIGPVNIGSEEMVTINRLAELAIKKSGKSLNIKHIEGPQGVRGRCSHNKLIEEKIGWKPKYTLSRGLGVTYSWIETQLKS